MPPTFRTLYAGDQVTLRDARENVVRAVFLGFSDWDVAHGEGALFRSWDAWVAAHRDALDGNTFAALDRAQAGREYGFGCYAVFRDVEREGDAFDFTVYRFEGGWVIGSSADRVSLVEPAREGYVAVDAAEVRGEERCRLLGYLPGDLSVERLSTALGFQPTLLSADGSAADWTFRYGDHLGAVSRMRGKLWQVYGTETAVLTELAHRFGLWVDWEETAYPLAFRPRR